MKVLFAGPDPDLVLTTSGDDREPGPHVSDVTKRMTYERDHKLNPDDPIDLETLDQGFTWEYLVEAVLSRRHKRQGLRPKQFQQDGLWCSPDWLNPDDPTIQHEEWKATKKSLKRPFDDISWHWMFNVKAYVRGLLELELIRHARTRFRVWYINGDYSFDDKLNDAHIFRNKYKVDVEFTRRELDENWRSILSHAQRFGMLEGAWLAAEEPITQALKASLKARSQEGFSPRPQSPAGRNVVTFPSTKNRGKRHNGS